MLCNIVLFGLLSYGVPAAADEIRIAVAANFIDVAREITPLFEQATGHRVSISYGSTGKLYSQIEHGAPFDVFLAADSKRPSLAEAAGLAVPGSRFVYAKGKLALWSAKPDLYESGETFLRTGDFSRIALANPKIAPYGLAAEQVMRRIGVSERLKTKLVRGDSVSQAFQFVATGNAEAGFIALAQIRAWNGGDGTLWLIPADYYAPIEQAAVLLKKGASKPAALAYLEFLKSDIARKMIVRRGYGIE